MARDERHELTVGSGVHGVLVIVAVTLVFVLVGYVLAGAMVALVGP